jgi:hypothetical protein
LSKHNIEKRADPAKMMCGEARHRPKHAA